MHLDDEAFLKVIETMPLVSIDLIIRNEQGQVLLGKRVNRPAAGFWFVPGGRIWKNERVNDAFKRISRNEIGVDLAGGKLLGVFDHIYDDNFAGKQGVNTQYDVLAYEYQLESATKLRPDTQHSELRWWDVDSLLARDDVHENTKAYFRKEASEANDAGKIGWVDLTTPKADEVRKFYESVTGWSSTPVAMESYEDFCMNRSGSTDPVAGICRARGHNADLPSGWLIYITVTDLSASIDLCGQFGGRVLRPPRVIEGSRSAK